MPTTPASPPASAARLAPGLALAAAAAAVAYAAARAPALTLVGPVVLALLVGIALRSTPPVRRRLTPLAPGVAFAARAVLKLGIVLLGVRLDARALVELGPWVLVGGALGAAVAFTAVELAGRATRVPADLRRSVAIGTAICGASAIAAAIPVLRARPAHATAAIAAISVLGTAGVLAFAGLHAAAVLPPELVAVLAGATLQEVGHVVAAGAAVGGAAGDLALPVKLARVVLLAPTLVLLALALRGDPAAATERRPALLPPFVLGFLAAGAATSAGWLPPAAVAAATTVGTALTATAMAAIGLGVEVRAAGAAGRSALVLGAVGFAALAATLAGYYALVLR